MAGKWRTQTHTQPGCGSAHNIIYNSRIYLLFHHWPLNSCNNPYCIRWASPPSPCSPRTIGFMLGSLEVSLIWLFLIVLFVIFFLSSIIGSLFRCFPSVHSHSIPCQRPIALRSAQILARIYWFWSRSCAVRVSLRLYTEKTAFFIISNFFTLNSIHWQLFICLLVIIIHSSVGRSSIRFRSLSSRHLRSRMASRATSGSFAHLTYRFFDVAL